MATIWMASANIAKSFRQLHRNGRGKLGLEVATAPVDLPVAVARRLRARRPADLLWHWLRHRTLRVFLLGCRFSITLLAHATEIGGRRRTDNGELTMMMD